MFENNILLYKLYKYSLEKYEEEFKNDKYKALKNMVNLYIKLSKTFFHDLINSIELWINEYGDVELLEYIQNKYTYKLNKLVKIISDKIISESDKDKFPLLEQEQVALTRADCSTGQVLDINNNLYNKLKQMEKYSIFDSLELAKQYIEREKCQNIEYVVYGRVKNVLYHTCWKNKTGRYFT